MKTMKNLFILGCVALMIAGCEATGNLDVPEEEDEEEVLLLKEEYKNDELSREFEYNSDQQITKYFIYENNKKKYTRTISYNGDDDVQSLDLNGSSGYPYVLNFARRSGMIVGTYSDNDTDTIFLNNDGTPREIRWYNGGYDRYTYNAAGNIMQHIAVERDTTNSSTISYVTTKYGYDYDDKKSPFYSCKTPLWFLIYRIGNEYQNNLKGVKTETGQGTFTYTYNSSGYASTCEAGNTEWRYEYIKP
ncbi:MAG: hypothetical protein LBS03_01770 [Bacteroidales bacterium]|nr:hypothetical protein [Bacteroidales bacterium]